MCSRASFGVEKRVVGLTEPEGSPHLDLILRALDLHRGPSRDDGAALRCLDVPSLALADAQDLIDGVVHRVLLGDRLIASVSTGDRCHGRGEQGRGPAAVATTGTESGVLGLDECDRQSRIGLLQVVRGPQTGVTGSHDGDVGVGVTLEPPPERFRQVRGEGCLPQRCHPRRHRPM